MVKREIGDYDKDGTCRGLLITSLNVSPGRLCEADRGAGTRIGGGEIRIPCEKGIPSVLSEVLASVCSEGLRAMGWVRDSLRRREQD